MATSSKKKATTELEFTKNTKRMMRFDADDEDAIVSTFYIKQGAVELDEEKEKLKLTIEVVKK